MHHWLTAPSCGEEHASRQNCRETRLLCGAHMQTVLLECRVWHTQCLEAGTRRLLITWGCLWLEGRLPSLWSSWQPYSASCRFAWSPSSPCLHHVVVRVNLFQTAKEHLLKWAMYIVECVMFRQYHSCTLSVDACLFLGSGLYIIMSM